MANTLTCPKCGGTMTYYAGGRFPRGSYTCQKCGFEMPKTN